MMRVDTLKVFLGGLNKDCFPPKIKEHLEWHGMCADEVFVPQNMSGGLSVAFCTFWTEEEAQQCIATFQGLADPDLTPTTLQAGGTIMEAFKVFR